MRITLLLATLTLLAFPAQAQDSGQAKSASKPKRNSQFISIEEIEAIRGEVATALDIVQRLRPQYLRARGANSFGNARDRRAIPLARVVLDGSPRGDDPSFLSQIPAMTVLEIRYIGGADATTQFGTGFDGGAILVKTR